MNDESKISEPIRVVHHLPSRTVGLGDVVASVAQPIARVIDAVVGTHLQGCGGCKKRQESLNQAVPNINPFNHGN